MFHSMASEKWLNFIEIKSHYLFSYLTAMKSRGYCIVGAEQTASGKYLHNTILPHKMILVLGLVFGHGSPTDDLNYNFFSLHRFLQT